jgi:DNA-binding Lrp family transcriptional regulator
MERQFKGVFIPAEIWEDKNLNLTEKHLFAEIDSFSRNGECFASNQHFSNFLGVSPRQIQNYLKSLKDKGYIKTTLFYKNGTKEIEKRVITPLFGYGKKIHDPTTELAGGYVQTCMTPPVENGAHPPVENCVENNTYKSTNTIINNPINKKQSKKNPNSSELESEFEQLWKIYPRKIGKANAQKSFIKARKVKKVSYETIEKGLYRYIHYLEAQGTDEQFIMHGSTWFNSEKWQDEYICVAPQKKPKNALDYMKQKYGENGGNDYESYGNGEIIDYYPTMLPEPFQGF